MSNRAEIIAGTNPSDPASYLRIDQTTAGGVTTLTFGTKANKTYVLQYADDLETGIWRRLADIASRPTDAVATATDPTGNPHRFYRVAVPGQP